MHFLYDAQSKIAQVEYNGAIYAYIKNFQGDVIGLLDSSGNLVVEYKYDAWGKPLAVEGSLANTLGRGNPFRYRGYVYDEETLLYYLRSRYYSHSISRFMVSNWQIVVCDININTYCYCANRATNAHDFDGRTWDDLVQAFKDAMMFSDGGNNKCYGYFRDPSKKSSLPSTGSSSYNDYPSRSCPNPNGRKGARHIKIQLKRLRQRHVNIARVFVILQSRQKCEFVLRVAIRRGDIRLFL